MMIRSLYRPLERCIGMLSGGNGDGLLWHTKLKPHACGDYSIAVVQANSCLEDQGQVFTAPNVTYVGVYDGHGGPEASRFINKHLFPYIQKFSREQGELSAEVIKRAFDATEKDFIHLVGRSFPAQPQIASVGSCCLVGAISKDTLYVANLGDSRAVLGRRVCGDKNPVAAERLSTDHNVCVEEVRKEVEALHPDDSHVVLYTHGVWRIKGIIQELHAVPIVDCLMHLTQEPEERLQCMRCMLRALKACSALIISSTHWPCRLVWYHGSWDLVYRFSNIQCC